MQIAGFGINVLQEIEKAGHVVRILEIRLGTETRIIKHYHYISWPDLGVPKEFQTLDSLLEDLHLVEGTKPIVIHCSAGVGRTGTFIALSHLKHAISAQKVAGADIGVSIYSIVRRLREQRIMMVETKEQYELLYDFAELWINKDTVSSKQSAE